MRVFNFGFKHFVSQCCGRFFLGIWRFFSKQDFVFKESFCVFQQGHCFSNDSWISEGTELIFHGALSFFVGSKISLFNESVGLFGFKHFVRQCCGRFFQLLVISWFWWLFPSFTLNSNWKIDFSSLWQNLGLGGCFV